jgi:cold-inducible RNA-binding protein
MGNKLYVGNLPYSYRDSDMEQAFSQYGTVSSAKVMMERDTGRSKGFGFVEMSTEAEAKAAIEGMNGQQIGGRGLVVNEARPMESRPPRTGGFGGGGGGGGRGGGAGDNQNLVARVGAVKNGIMGIWEMPSDALMKQYADIKLTLPKAIADANALLAQARTVSTTLGRSGVTLTVPPATP